MTNPINEVREQELEAEPATREQRLEFTAAELRAASKVLEEAILDVAQLVANGDHSLAEHYAGTLKNLFIVRDSIDSSAWSIDKGEKFIEAYEAAHAEEVDA